MYLELADLAKISNTCNIKLRIIFTRNSVFPKFSKYMVPKLFKKYYDGKCSHSTFSMPKTITQFRPDDQNKGSESKLILLPTLSHLQIVF